MRQYYQNNKEKKREWSRHYYYTNHEMILQKIKEYRLKHPIKTKRAVQNWLKKNKERKRITDKKYREINHDSLIIKKKLEYLRNKKQYQSTKKEYYKINNQLIKERANSFYHENKIKFRLEVLNHYSNREIKCACCGYIGLPFMTMDHENGWKHLHKRHLGGINLIWWLRKNNFPSGFQVLCYNCNCSKGFFGQCGHKFQWEPINKMRRWKLKFLQAYSDNNPKCSCCGEANIAFLSIDHINGNHKEDTHENGKKLTASNLYLKLKKLGFPKGYQVLCYNCNCAKANNAICPHKTTPNLN